MTDVTVILNGYPTKTLHNALVRPIVPGRDDRLALLNTREVGADLVPLVGRIYAAALTDVSLADLEAFFRSIPAGSYGVTQGAVTVNHDGHPDLIVNRIGRQPAAAQ